MTMWLSVDSLADKYPSISPYAYCVWNPIKVVDSDGKEPIKPYVGTVAGFVKFMNGLSTGIGKSTGIMAHAAMLRMGETKGLKPANTAPFNRSGRNRYIYTKKGGWIDMAHFMFYAGRAYNYKLLKQQARDILNGIGVALMSSETRLFWMLRANISPEGEALQDGYWQEFGDKILAPHSAYSYEDLPTDRFGADFGANYFDPNSKKTFSEQVQDYLNNVLNATSPQNAPNYNELPDKYPDTPSRTNKTAKPIYIDNNP